MGLFDRFHFLRQLDEVADPNYPNKRRLTGMLGVVFLGSGASNEVSLDFLCGSGHRSTIPHPPDGRAGQVDSPVCGTAIRSAPMPQRSSVEIFQDLVADRLDRIRKERLLQDARAKLDRAGEHLDALEAELDRFRKADSHSIEAHTDPDSGAYLLRVQPLQAPPRVGAIVGDILCNLRATLDYLVYSLAYLDSGSPQDGTQFPICDSPDYFERKRKGWLKGLSADHVAAIEKLQPYDGRDELLWLRRLRDLSNPDKHKRLSVVAGQVEGAFEVLDKPKRVLKTERIESGGIKVDIRDWADIEGIAERLDERGKAQAEEERIRVSIPKGHRLEGADVYVQVGLGIEVAFEDGSPVRQSLQFLHLKVGDVLKAFEPEFQAV